MVLRLRRTNLAAAYKDWVHYSVVEDCHDVGRIYEDRAAPAERRWSWSVTIHVNPIHGILTGGQTSTLDEAKAAFRTCWENIRASRNFDFQRAD
jgi:hypothetical protein